MAKTSVTEPSTDQVERLKEYNIGLPGLLAILKHRNYETGPAFSSLGKLSDEELMTVRNQGNNVFSKALMALAAVSELLIEHRDGSDINCTGVGCLLDVLAELIEQGDLIRSDADVTLQQRGISILGERMKGSAMPC